MQFPIEIDLLPDFQAPEHDELDYSVEWGYDPEYEPEVGLFNKYVFEVHQWHGKRFKDISDLMTDRDNHHILKLVEQQAEKERQWYDYS